MDTVLEVNKPVVDGEKPVVARDLATQLIEVEQAVGAALAKAALLTESLVFSQNRLNLSPTVGYRAVDGVGAAVAALSTANSQIATVHRRLDEIRGKIGIEAVDYAGGDKPQDDQERPTVPG